MLAAEDMKLKWTYEAVLGVMAVLIASPASATIDPSGFLATIHLEYPAARVHTYHLNANLFPTHLPARLPDLHRAELPGPGRLVIGKLVQAHANSPSLFPNINLGGDAYNKNTEQDLGDNDAQNLTYRIPYEHLTPYVYGGAAYKFDGKSDNLRPEFKQMGVGTELRLLDNWSVYVDGRYVFRNDVQNSTLARAGLRFSF